MKSVYKKFGFILITAVITVIIFALPNIVKAEGIMGMVGSAVGGLAGASVGKVILYIIDFLVNFIGIIWIGIAASLVNYVFHFQSFLNIAVVQIGWTMSRDIANMGFILIMLAMAFGTILRRDDYGWKKLLPKLIFVALLINFSLIIGGVFIDMGNSLGLFFVSGGNGESADVGDFIMTAMQAGQWAQMRNEVSTVGDGVTRMLMAGITQLVFYLIMAFLLVALAFIMIFRMINLWILLIMAPLAWISYALPKFGSYWGKWWDLFFKWAFFPAVMGFFIFLGLLAGASLQGAPLNTPDVGGFWSIIFPESLFMSVMQFIIVVAILFIGLSQAGKLSGIGSKTMMNGINVAQKWGVGKMKGVASGTGRYGLGKAGGLAQRALYEKGAGGQRTDLRTGLVGGLQQLSKIPLIGRGAGTIAGGISKLAEQRKKITEKEEEKLKKNSVQTLRLMFPSLSKEGQAAAIRVLADKGALEMVNKNDIIAKRLGKGVKELTKEEKELELTDEEKKMVGMLHETKNGSITREKFESALKYAGTIGLDKEILIAAPQFAEIVGKKMKEIIEKISPSQAAKIQRGSLERDDVKEEIKNAVIAKSWDSGQINSISKENPKAAADLLEFLKNSLTKQELTSLPKKTKSYIEAGGMNMAVEEEEEKKKPASESELVDQFNRPISSSGPVIQPTTLTDQFGKPIT